MKTVSVTEAKNNLSAIIEGLRGGPVMILDRGRPVARMESAEIDPAGGGAQLERLVREGLVTPARRKLPRSFWTQPLLHLQHGGSVVQALLEERAEGL